jgi:hypothetical protein
MDEETKKAEAKLETDGVSSAELKKSALDEVVGGTEQTLNIGSQSSGAGAGKVTLDPFVITKKTDASTPGT